MSHDPSTQNRGVTISDFRPCSTYRSHSQAPFYYCALRTIANRTEGTFELLRYSLGGDHPSQTTQLALFPIRIHGTRLEFPRRKSGISLMAPQGLAPSLQSLPPILHKLRKNPILAYSKGSRGLSVLPRVSRIFTTPTISPSLQLRQCPSRYAIHARRNLPDKELRYLRTVIVTAAIHWGFRLQLRSNELTAHLNLPASGRRQSVYIHLRVSTDLCFW